VAAAPPNTIQESHAHGVLSLIILLFGAGVGYLFSPILTGLLGLLTLWIGWKFFKWRVDPVDMFFWMKSKPSWAAAGMTLLLGLAQLGIAYLVLVHLNNYQFISVRWPPKL
jgi:hypothetical protein